MLDCVGQPAATWLPHLNPSRCFATLVPGSAVFLRSVLNLISGRKGRAVLLKVTVAALRLLADLASAGKLRVVVAPRCGLDVVAMRRALWTIVDAPAGRSA
jgi:hypothetical protein